MMIIIYTHMLGYKLHKSCNVMGFFQIYQFDGQKRKFYGAEPSYLGSGLTGGLSLSGHGSLELKGQLDVFDLHPLHLDAPVICSVVQSGLRRM